MLMKTRFGPNRLFNDKQGETITVFIVADELVMGRHSSKLS